MFHVVFLINYLILFYTHVCEYSIYTMYTPYQWETENVIGFLVTGNCERPRRGHGRWHGVAAEHPGPLQWQQVLATS